MPTSCPRGWFRQTHFPGYNRTQSRQPPLETVIGGSRRCRLVKLPVGTRRPFLDRSVNYETNSRGGARYQMREREGMAEKGRARMAQAYIPGARPLVRNLSQRCIVACAQLRHMVEYFTCAHLGSSRARGGNRCRQCARESGLGISNAASTAEATGTLPFLGWPERGR
jgi:hypothetical protein